MTVVPIVMSGGDAIDRGGACQYCLYSTIALYPKNEIEKTLFHGKKIIVELRSFFLG